MIKCRVFEYLRESGRGCMTDWLRDFDASVRAKFHARLDQLERYGVGEGVDETRNMCPHIAEGFYKLKVKSVPVLRPFLCRGHEDVDTEITFLAEAVEEDNVLHPSKDKILSTCRDRYSKLIGDRRRRQAYDRDVYQKKKVGND